MMALLSSATFLKNAASDTLAGDLGEEALNHIEPGSRGRCEVQVEARMRVEPAFYGRGLMGCIVVDDQMQVEIGRGLMIDQFEKAQELSMPMARQASSNDCAIQHIQRREQGGGAVSLVVVGHGAGAPLLHGQAGLGAVEGLDLALFVNAENQRLVRRTEIEPDYVLYFGGEVRVARN